LTSPIGPAVLHGPFSHPVKHLHRGLEAPPHALRLVLGLDVGEQARMLGELFRTGQKDD